MIEIRGLTRRFGDLVAVDALDLKVEKGDLFGFIGPNGAGKTTTMRILASLLLPTVGDVWVDGISVVKHPREAKRRIGYMPDFFGFYDNVRVWECLHFYAAAFKIGKRKRMRLIDDVLELMSPAWFHLGGDEAWHMGSCPRCRKAVARKGKGTLYLEHVVGVLAQGAEARP